VISRVADHCFWVGRYVERAESTARLLQVTRALAFDAELPPLHCWRPLVIVSGPGTVTALQGGGWYITGLSTTQATRVRMVKSYTVDTSANFFVYMGNRTFNTGGIMAGDSIMVADAKVTITNPNQVPLDAAVGTATYTYDNLGQLRWEVDATGRRFYHIYDNVGRKVADISKDLVTGLGEITEYKYDADDRLVATVRYANTLSAAQLTSLETSLTVAVDITALRPAQSAGDLWNWKVYDKEGRLRQVIDGLGWTTIYDYDGAGRLIASTAYKNNVAASLVATYKTSGGPADVVYPTPLDAANDRVTRSFYDKDGRLVGTLDGEGYVTRNVYDSAGQKVEEIGYANASLAADRAAGTFATILSHIAADAANDRHTHYVYDGQGQLRFTVDANFQVSETRFNNSGEAIASIRYATAISSATTDYTFDNLKALVAAGGFATVDDRWGWMVYDSAGRVAQTIDDSGFTTINSYNLSGQLTKSVSYANNIATATVATFKTNPPATIVVPALDSANDRTTRNYYDGAGVLRYVVDAEGYVTRRTQDAEGRTILVERFANSAAAAVSDSTTVDSLHNWVVASGGVIAATATTYDVDGRVATVTDAEGGVTAYGYNVIGQQVKVTDARGAIIYNYYDGAGRLTQSVQDAVTLKYITETAYNSFGEVVSVTRRYIGASNSPNEATPPAITADARDATTLFDYDRLGQVKKATDAEGYFETYGYNAFGDRVQVIKKSNTAAIAAGGTVTNTFDRMGRLLTETLPMASVNNIGTVIAGTVTNKFSYNAFGDRTQMIEAFGLAEARTTNYDYNRLGQLIAKRGDAVATASFNDFSQPNQLAVTVTPGSVVPTESYAYDAFGNVNLVTDANGAKTYSYYNRTGTRKAEVGPLGTLKTWTYDYAGDAMSQRIYGDPVALPSQPGGTPPSGGANFRETTYTYDKLGRLKSTNMVDRPSHASANAN